MPWGSGCFPHTAAGKLQQFVFPRNGTRGLTSKLRNTSQESDWKAAFDSPFFEVTGAEATGVGWSTALVCCPHSKFLRGTRTPFLLAVLRAHRSEALPSTTESQIVLTGMRCSFIERTREEDRVEDKTHSEGLSEDCLGWEGGGHHCGFQAGRDLKKVFFF